ncbi:hypothetical protein [Nannocystis sp. SCPEA4]|uniref:hypothetical protein n=1 Tax=Nannocystis sp. SCPEA4 TaxID=2996787 RepID=UPI00226DC99A|nr:hypothetical protein [Nannocystis sp. SCPEA4]MCY1054402.1 hypothetical protein [Nannocystis sp. SCPEA4]
MRPVVFILAFAAGGCRIPNPDHCVHRDVDSDAWCAEHSPARPYCSPCAAEAHGCVKTLAEVEACPAYEPDDGTGSGGEDTAGSSG